MIDAKTGILTRLRATQPPAVSPAAAVAVRRFDWDSTERLARFQERLEAVRGQVQRVGADWPLALHDLLRRRGVTDLLCGAGGPVAAELKDAWPVPAAVRLQPYQEPIEHWRGELFDEVQAGFTGCRGAIAETGTLVLWPDIHEPRLLSLVPPLHVVLLDAGAIFTTFAELLHVQGWAQGLPTNALLITGPSKSADIEQTLTYGVHGPKELIVLVRDAG